MTANRTILEWYPANGDPKVVFGHDFPYRLQNVEGLDTTLAQGQSIKSPSQYGTTLVDVAVPSRVVTAQILLAAEDMDAFWAARRLLARSLSGVPARVGEDVQLGTLRVLRGDLTPVEARAYARDSPKISKVKHAPMGAVDIEWEAPYPFWREIVDSFLQFEAAGAGLEFSLEMPFEMEENNVEQEVDNDGDVDAPILARLYGDSTTTRIINVTTGETLEVTGNIAADEYVEVNTEFGEKSVVLVDTVTGVRTSILDRVNLSSADFWSLRPGINVVRYEADVNVSGHALLYWRQRYTGV